MKKWQILILVAIPILFVIGLYGQHYVSRNRFEVAHAKKDSITEAIYALGTIRSHEVFEYRATIPLSVESFNVEEGDTVSKNQKILKFTEGQTITSPINGTVTRRAFNAQENIPPNQVIIQIQNLSKKYIEVSLEQEAALRVKVGQSAKILLESLRGTVFTGTVTALFPRSGEFLIHIEPKDLQENILPDMTADVSIEIGKKENALLIPLSSVDTGMVQIRRNGKKQKVKVEIGFMDSQFAEVTTGDIQLDDEILIPIVNKKGK